MTIIDDYVQQGIRAIFTGLAELVGQGHIGDDLTPDECAALPMEIAAAERELLQSWRAYLEKGRREERVEENYLEAEVWVLHAERQILVTDFPGPPASICGYVSEEAHQAAQARGYATVSEIGFPADCYLGSYPLPTTGGWGEAREVAKVKAQELGYKVVFESPEPYDEEGANP